MSKNWLKDLEQLAHFNRDLAHLARTTTVLMKAEDLSPLDKVWRDRGRVASRLEAAYSRLEPVFANWEEETAGLAPEQKKQAEQFVAQVEKYALRVLEEDRKVIARMEDLRDETKEALGKLKTGRRLLNAYGQSRRAKSLPRRISTTG